MIDLDLTHEPTVLGVVGGGQLCRMMCEAAAPLGVEVVFLDPTPDAPAAPVARDQIVAGFDDVDGLAELVDRADVLTYDIELADPDAVEAVDPGIPVDPHPGTLRLIQDKLRQKDAFADRGIPVPAYRAVDDADDVHAAADELGLPLMLKARMGGYDGRGNVRVDDPGDVADALATVDGPCMVEEFVPYDRELSVIVARGPDTVDAFPTTETVHEEQILRRTLTPARTSPTVRDRARDVASSVLETLDGRGVYGIELFEADGDVLVNEVAPRPHNSGHWTIEGAVTSQFEQHVRAVTGRPLGSTELRDPTVTVNLLGTGGPREVHLAGAEGVLATPRAHLHWYGKREERPLRKMGHVTVTDDDVEAALRTAEKVHRELRFVA